MRMTYQTADYSETPQYNGNIASLSWRAPLGTCRDIQGYHFTYDAANRLKSATSWERTSGSPNINNKYSEPLISYDLNGNITRSSKTTPKIKHYRWYDVSDSYHYLRVFDAQVCTMLRKNIRSWLTGINNCGIQAGDNLADAFSMRMTYETADYTENTQYNGNIASLSWRAPLGTCRDIQGYHFSYDGVNRLRVPLLGSATALHLR